MEKDLMARVCRKVYHAPNFCIIDVLNQNILSLSNGDNDNVYLEPEWNL